MLQSPASFHPHRAIILLGHGSRDPYWAEPMQHMQTALAEKATALNLACACAYLELTEPDLFHATEQLLKTYPQIEAVMLYPVFIGLGAHARDQLPKLLAQLAQTHPSIHFSMAPALGTDQALVNLVVDLALGHLPLQNKS